MTEFYSDLYTVMMDLNNAGGLMVLGATLIAGLAVLLFLLRQVSAWSDNARLIRIMKVQERHIAALQANPVSSPNLRIEIPHGVDPLDVLDRALSEVPQDVVRHYEAFGGQIPATVAVRPKRGSGTSGESSAEPK